MIHYKTIEADNRPVDGQMRRLMDEFIAESRLVIREYRSPDGERRLEMEIQGDGLDADPDEEVGMSFMTAATMFAMWNDGTVLAQMTEKFGVRPKSIEISLENVDGSSPGNA